MAAGKILEWTSLSVSTARRRHTEEDGSIAQRGKEKILTGDQREQKGPEEDIP